MLGILKGSSSPWDHCWAVKELSISTTLLSLLKGRYEKTKYPIQCCGTDIWKQKTQFKDK
jgi:hypothetical protein